MLYVLLTALIKANNIPIQKRIHGINLVIIKIVVIEGIKIFVISINEEIWFFNYRKFDVINSPFLRLTDSQNDCLYSQGQSKCQFFPVREQLLLVHW